MLEAIREKIQGWIAGLIVLLIAIPLGLWGINSYFEGAGKETVATVGDAEISAERYRQALEQQRRMLQQALGGRADMRMFEDPAFKRQVLERLVDETLLQQAAREGGYWVGDAQVAAQIRAMPQFSRNGQFDPQLYQDLLARAGYSITGFEQGLRQDLMFEQMQAGFARGALVPASEIEALARLDAQQRKVSYFVLKPEQFLGHVSVPKDAIESYYEANQERFMKPERVRVAYVRLSTDQVRRNVSVTEDELRRAYEEESARFVTPEERRASHILIEVPKGAPADQAQQAQTKLAELRKQLLKGTDFAALAKQHSQDPGSAEAGGDLGFARRGTFAKAFDAVLFALKPGEISEPVRTEYGFHLIKLTGVKPEVRTPFAKVRSELEQALRTRKAEERLYELSERLQNLVYENPGTLKPAAESLGLDIEQSNWLTREGGKGIFAERAVLAAAFEPEIVNRTRNSDPIDINGKELVVLRVIEHEPASAKPLPEVSGQIESLLRRERAQQEAIKAGESAVAALREGVSIQALAREHRAQARGPVRVQRNQSLEPTGSLVAAIFRAPRPDDRPTTGGIALNGQGYGVFAVTKVVQGEIEAERRQELKRLLERRRTEELFGEYVRGLRETIPVEVYPDRL